MSTGWLIAAALLLAPSRPHRAGLRVDGSDLRTRVAASRGAAEVATPRAGGSSGRAESFGHLGRRAVSRPRRAAGAAGGAVLAALALAGVRVPVAAAASIVVAVTVDAAIGVNRSRRERRAGSGLTTALAVLESELVAGAREDTALRAAAAVAGELAPLLQEAAATAGSGDEAADVLTRSVTLRPLAAAWRVRHACGAPLADVVAQVARDADQFRQRGLAVDTALAGPRSSSALLAGLPLLGIGLGTVMGARPVSFLGSGNGSLVLLVGVGLDAIGWTWTAAMVRRARR